MPKFLKLPWRVTLVCVPLFLTACGSIPVEKREGIRQDLIARGDTSLADFKEKYPEIEGELASSEGYLIAWLDSGMAVFVKGLGGKAILYDKRDGSQTFLNVGKAALGVGVGGQHFEQLFIFQDREPLEKFKRGRYFVDPAAFSAAGEAQRAALPSGEGSRYVLNRSGAMLTADVGVVRVAVNQDLTDTGVSDWSLPNMGYSKPMEQTEGAPRTWQYRLPFLAQAVVDKGYDLPIPYGIGLSFVDVQQDVLIEELQVGFNGDPIVPYEFVSFENTKVDMQSTQLKLDAWLFPFMNVYALLGKVKGDVQSDVNLDGNTLLDQLGTDCNRLIPPLECLILRDKNFVLPIRVPVDTTTYGFGTVLAGGWKGWFVVLPLAVTYTKGRESVTDGNSFTITPRVGRAFNIRNLGNMAVYVGGNRLDSDLSVTGTFAPDDLPFSIGYGIKQKNVDKWNGVVGFNWDFAKHINWSVEYNGFTGSRETWMTSINIRL